MIALARLPSRLCAASLLAAAAILSSAAAAAEGTIRIAFGDIATVESLHFLVALERARERGADIQITFFNSEDLAAQAIVGGQADVGVGTPYALVQKVRAPIRMFFQMSTLNFYPVVNTEFYQDWKDLDGQDVAVHSRGSGTEAIMKLMAQRNGITFGNVSYVPGSEVRTGALLQGNVKASIVDSAGLRILNDKAPGRFAVLPVEGVEATDEALYASTDFLEREAATVDLLVEELLRTMREIDANPAVVSDLRERYGLLPELPEELEGEIVPYFEEAATVGTLSLNGGGEEAVRDDFEFYALAGQIEGDPATLDVADFWDFRSLDRALATLGRQ